LQKYLGFVFVSCVSSTFLSNNLSYFCVAKAVFKRNFRVLKVCVGQAWSEYYNPSTQEAEARGPEFEAASLGYKVRCYLQKQKEKRHLYN
jgi:hypothetical protein